MFNLPDFFLSDFTYVRNTAGSYSGGTWVEGAPEQARSGQGAIQPMTPQEVEILSEGQRHKESIKIYTSIELKEVDEINKVKGDIVTARGKQYEVQRVFKQVTPWAHYKVIAVEVDA